MKDKTVRALTYVRNMKRTQIWLVNLERYHMGDWHNRELKTSCEDRNWIELAFIRTMMMLWVLLDQEFLYQLNIH